MMCSDHCILSLIRRALSCNWWDFHCSFTKNFWCGPWPWAWDRRNYLLKHSHCLKGADIRWVAEKVPASLAAMTYLQNGLHVGADEPGGIGDQVPQHSGTLLFDSSNATVLQLCQNLQERKGWHGRESSREEQCIEGETRQGTRGRDQNCTMDQGAAGSSTKANCWGHSSDGKTDCWKLPQPPWSPSCPRAQL